MDIPPVFGAVLAASTVVTIGAVIAVLVGVGAIVFLIANLRSGRAEPNRKTTHPTSITSTTARPIRC